MSLKRKAGNNLPSSQDPKKAKNSSITSFFGQPKPVHNANSSNNTAPVTKFDKDAWVAGLTEEQKTLLQLEIDTLDVSWLKELKDEVLTKDFLDLKRFLKRELEAGKTIFPKMEDVYSWFVIPDLNGPSRHLAFY
jgi:uracil-DNA glycosylase